jgi:hypothetical protein
MTRRAHKPRPTLRAAFAALSHDALLDRAESLPEPAQPREAVIIELRRRVRNGEIRQLDLFRRAARILNLA